MYDDDFTAANVMLAEAFPGNVSVKYVLPHGETNLLTVYLSEETTGQREVQGVQTIVRRMACQWYVANQSTVNLRATVTVGEEDWAVTELLHKDDSLIAVQLERHELSEHARPGYRRQ